MNDSNASNNAVKGEAWILLRAGLSVIRLKPRSKKPWSDESHDASMITWENVNTLTADDNIGVYFTKGTSLRDMDYDFKSSADLAEEVGLVEASASFGRASFGVTHTLYNSPGCKAKKFILPEGEYSKPLPIHDGEPSLMVLEIRGAPNTLTMVPPSIHPTGEKLEWKGNKRDPLEVSAEELRSLAGRHALAAVVLYFYPENAATRFEVRMALAGALIRSGMSTELTATYVQGVAHLAGDPKWREDFAEHTEERIEDDRPATGIPKLVEALGLPDACKRTFQEWLSAEDELILDPKNPMRSARELVARKFIMDGTRTLHRYRGAFWSWTGSYYALTEDEGVGSVVWMFLEKAKQWFGNPPVLVPFWPNCSRVSNVVAALGALCQLSEHTEAPMWLSQSEMPLAGEFLACGNGLLHLPTGHLHQPTPDYFNLSASEVTFDPTAPEPQLWFNFLNELFGNDQQAIELQQEWFGYSLSPDTSQQKILLLIGPKRSGKGTIARILTKLLGLNSVAGPTMSSLGENFGLEPLITKPMAIVSDARIGQRTDKSVITERLLSISGEDTITVPRKFRQAWNGRLMTRIMILTNELPSLTDGSGALAGRFVVLMLTESFFGREDHALTNKLTSELSGIFNWAIKGYRELRKRGHFIQPDSSKEAINDIEMLAAPVKAFVNSQCQVGPGFEVTSKDLWGRWNNWCTWEGRRNAGTKAWFLRNLMSAQPGLKMTRPRNDNGEQVPTYSGIKLIPMREQEQTPNRGGEQEPEPQEEISEPPF